MSSSSGSVVVAIAMAGAVAAAVAMKGGINVISPVKPRVPNYYYRPICRKYRPSFIPPKKTF